MNTQKKICEFNLSIGVPNHDVNSDTFLTSLTCITDIISVINNDLSPSRKLEIRVKALKPGSFECSCFIQDFIANASALLPLVTNLDLEYYKEIIDIVIDILRIKQFLKGDEAVKQEKINNGVTIKIENNHGNTLNVSLKAYNYYVTNQTINDAVGKNFEKLNADDEVSTFSLKTEENQFKSDRNDFIVLQQKRIVDEKKIKEIVYQNQLLYMFKLVWDSSNKWGFVWNGAKIQAYIKDDNFFKRIDKGEKFAKGDTITADIKIYQIYDHSIDNWLNDSFEIISIKKHVPRAEQIELTFEEN
jgi:hypothetical protein